MVVVLRCPLGEKKGEDFVCSEGLVALCNGAACVCYLTAKQGQHRAPSLSFLPNSGGSQVVSQFSQHRKKCKVWPETLSLLGFLVVFCFGLVLYVFIFCVFCLVGF